jgi:hypothetical protein
MSFLFDAAVAVETIPLNKPVEKHERDNNLLLYTLTWNIDAP